MTDLLDEVQEDLKEERYGRIIHKVSRVFISVAVIALLFTAVYVWKENTNNKLQYKLGVLFNKALLSAEAGNLDESITYFDQVIEQSHQQYVALAYLQKAAILVKQNKYEQAQKILLEMSKNTDFDIVFRDLAQVVFLGNQLQINGSENPQEMFAKLLSSDNPWQLSALQLKALYNLRENKIDDAKITLNEIIHSEQASKYSQDTASSILSVISRSK